MTLALIGFGAEFLLLEVCNEGPRWTLCSGWPLTGSNPLAARLGVGAAETSH
jgi:hypothetical protein